MTDPTYSGFGGVDWAILGLYFLLLLVTGLLLSKRQDNTHDYFLGGGRIPTWAASISLLATSLSAATFIGGPQQAYRGDLTYLSANIGAIIAILIVAFVFIPAFYRNRVPTVYGLLHDRFGGTASKAAGGAFIIGRIFASGARLYIAALPASLIVFGDLAWQHQFIAITAIMLIGIVYTLAGGIRAVIWTDVIQTFVFVGAAIVALVILLNRIPVGIAEITAALSNPAPGVESKLTTFRFGLEGFTPKHTYTILTAIFGFSLLNLGAYGTDQDLAQRMLTCKTAVKGSWSAIMAVLIGLPVTALFMGLGLLLWVFYTQPELMGMAAPSYEPEGSRQIFLTFILSEMPVGMTGIMMTGLFAAGLSSLNSAVNAMSSSFINDFYKGLFPNRPEKHYLKAGRWGVVVAGLSLGLFACFSVLWQEARPDASLIDFALMVMVFAYSGLTAVFLSAILTRRGSEKSVVAALVTGFVSVLIMQSYFAGSIAFPWQMFIATGLAFGVCQVGNSSHVKA